MLSSRAVKILVVLKCQTDWVYASDLEKKIASFDWSAFRALVEGRYVDAWEPPWEVPDLDEYGNEVYPKTYHINDKGLAYLEGLSATKWERFRSWSALMIAFCAMIISLVALFKPF